MSKTKSVSARVKSDVFERIETLLQQENARGEKITRSQIIERLLEQGLDQADERDSIQSYSVNTGESDRVKKLIN